MSSPNSSDPEPSPRGWRSAGSGTNSQGNRWTSRDYGDNVRNDNSYHYSNKDGSWFYSNPDGSKYFNDGKGNAKYTPPAPAGHNQTSLESSK